jgi:membrane-bound serine protease (ClpP class)
MPAAFSVLAFLAALWFASFSALALAQSEPDAAGAATVYVVPITGTIDLGLAPYLSRVLGEAAEDGAAAVVLRIDTPGGRLDAVLQMRDALLAADVPTIAFVDRTAFSAGALVALASEQIYLTPGAAMGAATPVDGATGETASEKTVSAVRTTFKATAEARGRDPRVAEAMVDPDVAIDGLVGRGELLTLTTAEAVAWGYADGVADDLDGVLAAAGLAGARVVETTPSLAERAVRFVTDPVAASLLIVLAVLLIVGDFFVEGFGLAGAAGLACSRSFSGATSWPGSPAGRTSPSSSSGWR